MARNKVVQELTGAVVLELEHDYQLHIRFSEPEGMLSIGGVFTLTIPGREAYTIDPDTCPYVPIAEELVQLEVESAVCDEDAGSLEVVFTDGSQLAIAGDPDYEAWQMALPDQALHVSLPGGGVAVWACGTEGDKT